MSGLPDHLLEPVEARLDAIIERVERLQPATPLGPEAGSDLERILTAARDLRSRLHALSHGQLPLDDPSIRHDLRTPLNHVLGYGEMLAQEAVELGRDDLCAPLDDIVRAGREILDRLDDVLAAARAALSARAEPRLVEGAGVLAFDLPGLGLPERPPDPRQLLEALEHALARHGLKARRLHGLRLLASSGAPGVERLARCGLELLEIARASGFEGRAGVHAGPLLLDLLPSEGVADLWGPVPAEALRVEEASAPGALTLSEGAWELLLPVEGARATSVGALRREGRPPVVLYRLEALP